MSNKFQAYPALGQFMHCDKCGHVFEHDEPMYQLTRGRFKRKPLEMNQVVFIADWANYEANAVFVALCETCAGFKGEWKL